MKSTQRYEKFIFDAIDESFDLNAFLKEEVKPIVNRIDNETHDKKLKILDADGRSSVLASGLALCGYDVYQVADDSITIPEHFAGQVQSIIQPYEPDCHEKFDAIIIAHDKISEYQTDADLDTALHNFACLLDKNGLLIFTTHYYDQLLRRKPESQPARVLSIRNQRFIHLSVWEWINQSTCLYQKTNIVIHECEQRYSFYTEKSQHRAWRRAELNLALSRAGFLGIQYHSINADQMLVSASNAQFTAN